jgi:hypothetical protein
MDYLAQLDEKLKSVLAAGSVGQPVFVRLTAAVQLQPPAGPGGHEEEPIKGRQPEQAGKQTQGNTLQRGDARSQPPGTDPTHLLAALIERVSRWVAQPVHSLRALQGHQAAHLYALVAFGNGATAIVSLINPTASGPGLDLLLLGNRGAVYCEQLGCSNSPATLFELGNAGAPEQIVQLIRASLQAGSRAEAVQ